MTGAEILTYTKRRLAENGLTLPAERVNELYDLITEARDTIKQVLADVAPVVVQQEVALEVSGDNYIIPAATKDPLKVLAVKETDSGADLSPSSSLNQDLGHYVWKNTRTLRLADNIAPEGGVTITAVLHDAPITAATAENAIGLPTTCHRAIGKLAAVLALTADEESDAREATKLANAEMERLSSIYGSYDANDGEKLRNALMATIGGQHGDTLT